MENNIDENIKEALKEVEDIKSGKVEATTWEDFKKELDIDKDIEIVEKKIEDEKDVVEHFKRDTFSNYPIEESENKIQAIEHLLSELETQINNTHILQSQLDIANAEKIEWKKIAEKIAKKSNMTKIATNIDSDNDWCNGRIYMSVQEIIDWARKEVENEKNNSNT